MDNSSGVRQSAKILFDDDFLTPATRCAKKGSHRASQEGIVEGSLEKQDG